MKNNNRLGAALAIVWIALAAACSKPTPQELMSLARDAVASGEMRTAQIHLKNLLRQNPDDASARALLGQVTLVLGDPVGAEADLRRALDLGADPAEIQIPLLRVLAAEGKIDAVLAQIESGPTLTGAAKINELRIAGAAYRARKQLDQAETAYRSALEIDAGSPDVRTDLASLKLEQGDLRAARELVVAVLTEHPGFAPALLSRARLEIVERHLEDAAATYGEIIASEQPSRAEYFAALSGLVELRLDQGKTQEAAPLAAQLIARFPAEPVAKYLKARVEFEQGEVDAAKQSVEQLLAGNPKFAPANRLLGTINARGGQVGQARMYLQAAITNDPTDRRALLRLAALDLRDGNIDAARTTLAPLANGSALPDAILFAMAGAASRALGQADLAEQFFAASDKAPPEDVQQVVALAAVLSAAGELDRASRLLEGPAASAGADAWIPAYALAEVRVRQGQVEAADTEAARLVELLPTAAWPLNLRATLALARGDMAAAAKFAAAALMIDPKFVPALLTRSRAALLRGDQDATAAELRRVLEVDPKNATALLGLAELALKSGDFAEAQRRLDAAPESTARFRLQGKLAAEQGRHGEAADLYASAFRSGPSTATAIEAYQAAQNAARPMPETALLTWIAGHPLDPAVNLLLGSVAMQSEDTTAAVARYEKVLAVAPDNVVALNNLAFLYGEKGDARALDLARRAHEKAPEDASIADTLGWLELQHGDPSAALPLLEQSRKARPNDPEIRYHLGAALAKKGDAAAAATELRAALEAEGDFRGRDDAERLLDGLED